MRYDDASQAGSMANDHSPVARPDVDALPPGSFGPASGNTITGAGTTTGASGEDSVGNPPAHIVAVQGAGGAATNANGNFQATGQYGVLNMDAQGNFNYVRNGGTPDGVQDVFNYTLANADGQSSTTLTIDIAKGGTGQAQVIPGTVIPGVVNLPAGVQMSDIHVNGRDLVINMPDGTQMVIPNGAVFVPQLVIGDVQLPPSNLAALLVESEPQPAAGQLPSSGGNFATDVPPLDPGVPLGDLIPPTELNFPPPTIEIIGQIVDRHPEAGAVSVQLDDDALPGGNPGGVGDDPDSVNATGNLPGSGGDAPIHWDLLTTDAPSGFSYVDGPNGSVLVQQVQGGNTVTVLTITIDAATGAYTVTENHPILHPAGGDENNVTFVINYNVVDVDGDTAAGTLTINVDDDTPVVTNVQTGLGVSLDETTAGSPAGFPISATSVSAAISANLSFGADGANGPPVYALSLNGGVSTLASGLSTSIGDHPITLNLTSSTLITATYSDAGGTHTAFTVALNANGTITVTQYVPLEHGVASNPDTDETLSLAGLVNATVTITDRDGDSATGTAPIGGSILFHDDGPSIGLADHGVANLVVDETDLSVNASASFAANFNANFGGDGPGGVSYALGISAPGANSGLVDSATGQNIVLVLNNGVVEGHVGTTGGALAFTVSVNASGVVTLDQIRAVIHPDGTNPDTDETVTLAANGLVTLTATATDSDGDTATASIGLGQHLIFHDDGPSISAGGTEPSLTVDETDLSTNASASFAGIFTNISFGADGPAASNATVYTLGISAPGANSGLVDSLTGQNIVLVLNGNVVEGHVGSTGGALAFTVSVDSSGVVTLDQIRAVIHPTGSNPDTSEGVTLGADNLVTLTATVTDKDGDSASATANIGQNLNFLDDGPSISASATQPSLTVDETNLAVNASASFASVFSPSFGNDGPAASNSLTYALGISASGANSGLVDSATGQNIVLVLNGGVVEGHVGTTGGALAFTVSVDSSGVVTLDQIRAVIHPTGSNPDTSEGVTLSADNLVTLTATATDADGDQATATANIGQNLNFLDDGPTINASSTQPTLTVDETNLAGNASASFASVFSGSFGNDGPAASNATVYTLGISAPGANSGLVDSLTGQNIVLVLNGNTVEGHVGTTGGTLAFTVTVDSSGVVTLDQIRAVIHGSPDVGDSNEPVTLSADNLVTLTATITDKDGDSASATANIGQNLVFLDDGPLAVNDTVNQPSENQSFSFNVFGNDSFGADGVDIHSLSHVSFTQPAQGTITYDTTTGLFTFTPAAGQQGSTSFTYTITDADGDHSTATVTINLANDSVPIPTAQVAFSDDDGLATGNPASTTGDIDANVGETPTTNPSEVIYNGQLVVNFGADTPGSITFANLNGTTGSVGTETVSYSWNAGTNTLTATTVGGSRPGTVLFDIHITNTATGTYVLTQHTNILEAAGGNETSAPAVVLHYQAVDSDGSTSTAGTLSITFNDDAPTVTGNGAVPNLSVDETNLAINASASFSGVFSHNFGADGAAASNSITYQLGISAPGASSGLIDSATGSAIVLVLNGGVVEGHVGTTGGALAFTVSVDSSGVVTLDQIRAVIHGTASNPDTSEGVTLSAANLVTLTQTVTDGDGDQASATANIGQNLNFLDDGPTASASATQPNLTVDETDLSTNASASFASVFTTAFGNDGAATSNSLVYQLGISAPGANSGLVDTATGQNIVLVLNGNVVEGHVGTTGGALAFTVSVDSSGVVTLDQIRAVVHGTPSNPDTSEGVTLSADNLVTLTVVVTDKDGDQATATANIGQNLNFLDDGPTAHINTTGQGVSLDESAGIQVDSNDTTSASVIALFSGVANKGVDTDLPQYATNANAIVNSTGTTLGADGGNIAFSLNVSAAGVDSGLNTTDGHDIFLFKEGNLIVGRVDNASGAAAFAIAIDSTGHVSTVEYLSIQHPDSGNPDDSVSIATGAVLAVVTATDGDGDTSTASTAIGNLISFQDSAPIMTAADNINIQNSGDVAASGNFAYLLGADGPPTNNDVFKSVTFSASVNGTTVQTTTPLTQVSEDSHTAQFSFSFSYSNGSGTVVENGTITFYKDNSVAGHAAGTYTVDLQDPISGISINQTSAGSAFVGYQLNSTTTDNTQPVVAVTTIQNESAPGAHDGFFVQFTGITAGNGTHETIAYDGPGDGTASSWVPGELISEGTGADALRNSWVSVSGSSNGVAGDTVNGPDALNFDLYNSNPFGNVGGTQTQSASNMFLAFDGIGSSEDMIVVLKLGADTNNDGVLDTFTTRAILVQNADIYKFDAAHLATTTAALAGSPYAGVAAAIAAGNGSNNDGLVIIESNDYNGAGEHYQIIGAEVVNAADGISGTGINLNSAVGAGGGSSASENFSDISDTGPLKITNIGFVTTTTTAQTADLTFNATIQDGDGDSITQTVHATVTSAADSATAISLSPSVTTVSPIVLDLNGDGVHFLGTDAGVHYDYGNGSVATAWASPQDGILAFDANHDGTVSNASEFVFGGNGVTDLQGLAAYDTNHDGQLSSADSSFSGFVVWQDANSNGVADAGEVKSLMALGITSISLSSDGISYTTANGDVKVACTGSYTLANGSTGQLADAAFAMGARAAANDDLRSSSALASNAALIAAVAAAGLASQPLAAQGVSGPSSASSGLDIAAQHTQAFAPVALDAVSGTHGSDLAAIASGAHVAAPTANWNFHASQISETPLTFDAASHASGPSFSALPQGTDAPAGGAGGLAGFTAQGVGMPSAAMLMAAAHGGLAGPASSVGPQHNEVVGKVLVDALHGGGSGPNVEALLNSLPQGGDHGHAAADTLASHAGGAVPNGDMGIFAGFTGASALHMMQQMTVHADAVPAHV